MKPDSSTADALRASLNTTFLVGGGEMGALIRAYDWSSTAIGAPENWPQGLKTAIRIMLTSRQPIWIGWGDALLFFYNDPYKSIIGGRHPVALGQPTATVWHEIWNEIAPLLAAALTGDEGIFVEQKLLIMERNGFPEETYYTFSYSPVPTDDGSPGGMICANSDDTSRVIGERQLMLLRELAASTADARFWRDVCEASARALETNPRDLPFALLYIAEPGGVEVTLAGASGITPGHPAAPATLHAAHDPCWPFADVLRTVGRDVTADKETTEALQHAEEALRVAQKMESIGKLTGGVAHDFNNLLQVIGGNLQLLAKDVAGDEIAGQRVRNALAGVARGANLASQLLAFGRRQPLAPKVVNLGRFIRGLDDMFRRALGDGIEIETVVSGGLWNTLVDPFQVENALLNLAINARDAMKGHGRLTMEAGNAALDDAYAQRNMDVTPGQYVMVALTDTGAGMQPEVRERAFEPFFTTKAEGQGTGLGLSMVYGFVKQSGGHVKIYSEPGHGTTVRIYLPRVRDEEDRETRVDAGPFKGGVETVLVVEDDEDVRATVVEMLSDLGYRVLKAKDAQSALAIVESGVPIHLLFTDVVMPGPLRSTELARKARERLPEVAVLFTSGYTDNAIVHAGRLDEGIELLSKPYTYEALARKVRHVIRLQGGHGPDDAPGEPRHAKATAVVHDAAAGHAQNGDSAADAACLRILYVEDDDLVRISTAELLRTFGLSVLEAEGEEQALRLLNEEPVDVLLTDVGLAGRSGVELAIGACRYRPHLPVVFLTGYDLVLTPAQQAALPEATSLRKPYDPLALVNLLMRHMQ